jgi:hypothetical protein
LNLRTCWPSVTPSEEKSQSDVKVYVKRRHVRKWQKIGEGRGKKNEKFISNLLLAVTGNTSLANETFATSVTPLTVTTGHADRPSGTIGLGAVDRFVTVNANEVTTEIVLAAEGPPT